MGTSGDQDHLNIYVCMYGYIHIHIEPVSRTISLKGCLTQILLGPFLNNRPIYVFLFGNVTKYKFNDDTFKIQLYYKSCIHI